MFPNGFEKKILRRSNGDGPHNGSNDGPHNGLDDGLHNGPYNGPHSNGDAVKNGEKNGVAAAENGEIS